MKIVRIFVFAALGILAFALPSAAILYVCSTDSPGPCAAQVLRPNPGEVIELYVQGSNGVAVTIDVSGGAIQGFVPEPSEVVEYHPGAFGSATRRIRIVGVRTSPVDPPSATFRLGSLTVDASSGSIIVAVTGGSEGVAAGDVIEEINPVAIAVATQDFDDDGVLDPDDNCMTVPNGPDIPDRGGHVQRDTDSDGYGNVCDADLNNDGSVNFLDLGEFAAAFRGPGPDADFDGDGVVLFLDLGLLTGMFRQPLGPSGLTCAGTIPCLPTP